MKNETESKNFQISSRTAQLIGRENIVGIEGSLIELVKNSYDADATNCEVIFDIPFPDIPENITEDLINLYFNAEEFRTVTSYYNKIEDLVSVKYQMKDDLIKEERKKVFSLFSKFNSIVISDDGDGMDIDEVTNNWLTIGTDNKIINSCSTLGRMRTGSKGIGRFALDTLGVETQIFTKSIKYNEGLTWKVNWDDFGKQKLLNDIVIDIEHLDITELNKRFNCAKIPTFKKNKGTVVIINNLREPWSEAKFKNINRMLENVNPFGEITDFNISINNLYNSELSKSLKATQVADYDYSIKGSLINGKLETVIKRNEYVNRIVTELYEYHEVKHKFDIRPFLKHKIFDGQDALHFLNSEITISDDENTLFKKILDKNIYKEVGDFKFELYFAKRDNSKFKLVKTVKDVKKRRALLDNNSGIKIYRDNFKVRPYGEKGTQYQDWLKLDDRAMSSPAAVTHKSIGTYRVRSNQIFGNILITKSGNKYLEDKSNREGLKENEHYEIFSEIILTVIKKFEYDRQLINHSYKSWLDKEYEKINYKVKNEIERKYSRVRSSLLDTLVANNTKSDNINNSKSNNINTKSQSSTSKKIYELIDAEVQKSDANFEKHQGEVKKLEYDKTVLLSLSTQGIIANSFAHDMNSLKSDIASDAIQIKDILEIAYKKEEDFDEDDYMNPYPLLDGLIENDKIITSWLGIAIEGIRNTDIEISKNCFGKFIEKYSKLWFEITKTKKFELIFNGNYECVFNFSNSHFTTLFNNLIINSIYYFDKEANQVCFNFEIEDNVLIINFSNNGKSLDPRYRNNPESILNLSETSKPDGEGTGLGMWIISEICNIYEAQLVLNTSKLDGFYLTISIPIGDE